MLLPLNGSPPLYAVRRIPYCKISASQHLLIELIDAKVIHGETLAVDSCPIIIHLKENNLKTSVSNRFDKTRIPDGDPNARLGIIIHCSSPYKREVRYFWGYRNHMVNDIHTELPLAEVTLPANVHEIKVAPSLLKEVKETYHLSITWVVGDANFDTEVFLCYIVHDLSSSPGVRRLHDPGDRYYLPGRIVDVSKRENASKTNRHSLFSISLPHCL